mgnify:CR=1 FL=1
MEGQGAGGRYGQIFYFQLVTFELKCIDELFEDFASLGINLKKLYTDFVFTIVIGTAVHKAAGNLHQVFLQSDRERNGMFFFDWEMGFQ